MSGVADKLSQISPGRRGLVFGLIVLAVISIALLAYHFTLLGLAFTLTYIAVVGLLAEHLVKKYHPGDIVMASIVLLAAGIYFFIIDAFHLYDLYDLFTTTVLSALIWTVVAEPVAAAFRRVRYTVRHYVEEEA